MGLVSSVSEVSEVDGVLAKNVPDKVAGDSFNFFGSVSSTSTLTTHRDLSNRVLAIEREGSEFCEVLILKQPLSSGVADHHGIVFWYGPSRHTLGAAGFPALATKGLEINWGQNGLAFCDISKMPAGEVVHQKECGVQPNTIAFVLQKFKGRPYNLMQWNCQHFCWELYCQATGNMRLNAELGRLQLLDIAITSVGIYQEVPGNVGDWTLVYWHKEGGQLHGLQVKWGHEQMDFEEIKQEPSDHNMVRWRETSTTPDRIRSHLQEIEGRPFDGTRWNCQQFTQFMFDRVLAKGNLKRLCDHLEQLSEDKVEIAGVHEMSVRCPTDTESPGEHRALVYKYKQGGITLSLWIHFHAAGCTFAESEQEPAAELVVRTKPMLFIRLQPKELQKHILDIQDAPFDEGNWNSGHFCNQLFNQVPGKARDGKAGAGDKPKQSCSNGIRPYNSPPTRLPFSTPCNRAL